ncbi:hypothetical protein JTE90_002968 [Oedothorax gibbosus]|uniref:Replication factor C subunit 1 n=1 Tax=Oedothorax gibbosus TaxID=931172 RepID=A0AAV6VFY2_9ARAC|nr:hypothetical protein JTE90_002968 [Oedothorax gibbosus]
MDIRRFFTAPKTNGSNQSEKKNTSKTQKQPSPSKTKPSKKRRIIESDSDDEDPIPKSDTKASIKKSPAKNNKEATNKNVLEKKKEVSLTAFFGTNPIHRDKKTEPPSTKKLKESSVHDDEAFQATLQQANAEVVKGKKQNGIKKRSLDSESSHLDKNDKTTSPVDSKQKKDKDKTSSVTETKKAKRKSKNESSIKMEITPNVDQPVKKIEIKEDKPVNKKPKGNGANYASYLHREGPRALGSKEIPEGEEDCLAGLTFVITGVLESLERDEAKSLIEKYSGKVMTTLSKNTKYMVVGRDAGSSKLEKAEKFGTIQVDEDGLLDLVRTRPGKKGTPKQREKKKSESTSKGANPEKKSSQSTPTSATKHSPGNVNSNKTLDLEEEFDDMDFDESILLESDMSMDDASGKQDVKQVGSVSSHESVSEVAQKEPEEPKVDVSPKEKEKSVEISKPEPNPSTPSFMWVDKYKPSSLKQVIGQQGDKSNAKKLFHWLMNWHKSRRLNKKPIPGRFNAADDGAAYKAALLSGPPGVGKTTTAILVCKEAGYDYFELNASDTRSKKNLQHAVSQLLGNQTLADCFKDDAGKVSNNHVIIMDEVDGMAGNEDRGGMMELISFIKASKVPIICICNDRNHTKIRSLANYCFDLRFQRPRVEQIKAAMLSIAFKENIQVSPNVLQDVIVASNQDIRQVLHNMSMWSAKSKGLSTDQTKSDIGRGVKHIKMGPFDVLREVFAIGNNPKATLMDKSDLFFHDYSISPLFVHENYVHVVPSEAQGNKIKHLKLLSEAADSICIGDIIDRQIRNQQSWSLLPTEPEPVMYLGTGVCIIDDLLTINKQCGITGNKTDVALDYLPLLKRSLTKPLIENETSGVPEVLKTMEDYYLLREDFDSIIDLSLWSGQTDPRTKIQTKVKSAFTRAYNKESGKNPYTVSNVKKKKASAKDAGDEMPDEENAESEEEEDDSIEKDAMIKVKKPPTKKGNSEVGEASTSKDKKKAPSKRGRSK